MVQIPNPVVPTETRDFRLPYRAQTAQNLSMVVGLGGGLLSILATMYATFAMASGDPGLAWMAILTVWSVWGLAMGVLWFATAEEAG